MILFRPVQHADLTQLISLAELSGPMVCTLPAQRRHLLDKIARSVASFAEDIVVPGEEIYFFVLEETETGELLGTAAIHAQAGFDEPFYAYRNDTVVHSSRVLGVHNRIHALSLSHALSDHSQLCSFFILPAFRQTRLPSLLTLGRLLFIAAYPERFSESLMAVIPGVADETGHSPFWEHVGRKFFGIEYNQAEYYNGTRSKTFIAELMPHHPLYVPLLHADAQAVIGLVNTDAQLQFDLLTGDGFDADQYVEIFDAGPIVTARRAQLATWGMHRLAKLAHSKFKGETAHCLVLSDVAGHVSALMTDAQFDKTRILLPEPAIRALNLPPDATVHFIPLPP